MTVRIGVAGLAFGRLLANDLQTIDGCTLTAVADHSGRSLGVPPADYAGRLGVQWFDSAEGLIDEAPLDAVVIATPPATHLPLVERAAARGLHVLLEKPMAAPVAECERMVAVAAEAGVLLAMAFPMRHLAAVRFARSLIEEELGAPLLVSADYVGGAADRLDHWVWDPVNGGGPITENTCHLIDTLRFLVGEPQRVTSFAATLGDRARPVPDAAAFALDFGGALAAAIGGGVSDWAMELGHRITIVCERGQLTIDGRYHVLHRVSWRMTDGVVQTRDFGAPPVNPGALDTYDTFSLHLPELESFVLQISTGSGVSATGEDGRAVAAICAAILESAAQARPIDLVGAGRD